MLTRLLKKLGLGHRTGPDRVTVPDDSDRAAGEEALATQEEELREATTHGTPRPKTEHL
jgi:hypothetical protein